MNDLKKREFKEKKSYGMITIEKRNYPNKSGCRRLAISCLFVKLD